MLNTATQATVSRTTVSRAILCWVGSCCAADGARGPIALDEEPQEHQAQHKGASVLDMATVVYLEHTACPSLVMLQDRMEAALDQCSEKTAACQPAYHMLAPSAAVLLNHIAGIALRPAILI